MFTMSRAQDLQLNLRRPNDLSILPAKEARLDESGTSHAWQHRGTAAADFNSPPPATPRAGIKRYRSPGVDWTRRRRATRNSRRLCLHLFLSACERTFEISGT